VSTDLVVQRVGGAVGQLGHQALQGVLQVLPVAGPLQGGDPNGQPALGAWCGTPKAPVQGRRHTREPLGSWG
jgi:hypothetical protein